MGFSKWPQKLIIISSIPLLILGLVETVVGFIVYNFTSNIKIGAWYVGMFALVNALIGFGVMWKVGFSGAYPIMCLVTATVALIGTLIDGIAYAVIGYLKACGNNGSDYWGEDDFYENVMEECELPATNRDCYCVISHNSVCFSYDGNGKGTFNQDDCNPLLDEYPVLYYAHDTLLI